MRCLALSLRVLCALLCSLLLLAAPAHAARVALVIGNADYVSGRLKNPVNDARAMTAKLGALGFAVTKVENLKRDDIGRAIENFAGAIQSGDEVVIYYAGHGVQVRGVNYFPAVDARIQREADVPLHSLNLNDLLELLDQARAGVKVVLLDACRDNPYAASMRTTTRGLARIANAPAGTLIHYATMPGKVAADGDGVNGLYTTQLLKALDAPGVMVELLFKQVATDVKRASNGEQVPWLEGHLDGSFYFNSGGGRPKDTAVAPTPAPSGSAGADFEDLEQAQRQTVEARKKWAAWQAAMEAAFDKAVTLTATPDIEAKAWERFLSAHGEDNPNSSDDERLRGEATRRLSAALAKGNVATPPSQRPTVAPVPTTSPSTTQTAGSVFRDCAECPEMVVIPAGRFEMGSNNGERNEKPVHSVDVRSFALGKYEVTQGQWMALMGGNPSRFANCGEECPVELVSWDDAKLYLKKLNAKVSGSEEGPYRLPSESEWEYACRGGGRHKYCGSDDVGSVAWYEWNSGGKTRRAGMKAPNGYGLHDLSGSVWEWAEDCWHESYSGAPTNGSAWTSGGDCSRRVERGGSWSNNPAWVRSVTRSRDGASRHINLLGFRVARTLP